ncbi:MAG: tRNA (adenosine(37)-N6)-threonylcarbamoyltransferase complex ATPase subunit type 1 TsaE [Bacteroidota bacterium]|jgi:tRNA threonylcarbamoyladenosine biosynthesis protein TsaE
MLDLNYTSLSDLPQVAQHICSYYPTQKIVCFIGEMGSGKTTLIKEICRVLGVTENSSSPTYSIVNEYIDGKGNTIYHFDLFRIKNSNELFDIGFDEYLFSGNLCLIEWPQIAAQYIDEFLEISIDKIDDATRKISLQIVK